MYICKGSSIQTPPVILPTPLPPMLEVRASGFRTEKKKLSKEKKTRQSKLSSSIP